MLPQQEVLPCDAVALGPGRQGVHDGLVRQHELAYVGLGANVGAARASLQRAVSALSALPGAHRAGVSRLYRTRPVGPVRQDDFLNAVVALRMPAGADPARGAMALLIALKSLERAMGRVERERWGPREIDLDLLLFGDHALCLEREPSARSADPARGDAQWLVVPHPSARERLFVLAPLADLAPGLEPPGWGESVAQAREHAREADGPDTVQAIAEWDERDVRWVDLTSPPDPRAG
jgi:2-amino-4-hydroxy-6-hydroxymethyldihydropteridine diphosphokinase